MAEQRAVFRRNLKRLAESQELSLDDLARQLGWKGEDKKWLRRLWDDGLERVDKRRRWKLNRLARFLGLSDARHFWKSGPEPEVNPNNLARTNEEAWKQLVALTADAVRTYDLLVLRYPEKMSRLEAEANYEELLAKWVRDRFFGQTFTPVDESLFGKMMHDWWGFYDRQSISTVQRNAYEALCKHAAWDDLMSLLMQLFSSNEQRRDRQVFDWFQEATTRPPSADEIYQRFAERHLDWLEDSSKGIKEDDRWELIVEELAREPEWIDYVDREYDGNEKLAAFFVRDKWHEFLNRSVGSITREEFVRIFQDVVLRPSGSDA